MKTTSEILNEWERRMKESMSPRLHMPEKNMKWIIAKLRAAERMAESATDNEGYAEEFWAAWHEYRNVENP